RDGQATEPNNDLDRERARVDPVIEPEDPAVIRLAVDRDLHAARVEVDANGRGTDPDQRCDARGSGGTEEPARRGNGRLAADAPGHVRGSGLAAGTRDVHAQVLAELRDGRGIAVAGLVGMLAEVGARAGDGVADLAHGRMIRGGRIVGGWSPDRPGLRSGPRGSRPGVP